MTAQSLKQVSRPRGEGFRPPRPGECKRCRKIDITVEERFLQPNYQPKGMMCGFCWGLLQYRHAKKDQLVQLLRNFVKHPTNSTWEEFEDAAQKYKKMWAAMKKQRQGEQQI